MGELADELLTWVNLCRSDCSLRALDFRLSRRSRTSDIAVTCLLPTVGQRGERVVRSTGKGLLNNNPGTPIEHYMTAGDGKKMKASEQINDGASTPAAGVTEAMQVG
ncbi:hypothetical protein EVAR_41276_1 [Eumeta japonica]|uniref:Uncharacterized protein n=1 Tax=Eumeta variegata TaxID=151549 RepID=A0A4C1XC30_EUMVA|nr:hypothetical protein EVAR_41276_1 [Eumeta japonica]